MTHASPSAILEPMSILIACSLRDSQWWSTMYQMMNYRHSMSVPLLARILFIDHPESTELPKSSVPPLRQSISGQLYTPFCQSSSNTLKS